VTVCYLRDRRDDIFAIDHRAATAGIDYTELLERHSFDASIWPGLRSLVRSRQIDLVHSHDYKTNLLAWLVGRAEGVATLATSHGWTGHSARERWLYYPGDKRLLARFPRVVAVSSQIKADLVAHGGRAERIDVLLNGIDPQVFRRIASRVPEARAGFGIAGGEVVIGAVGRLEPQKRFDLLIEAFAGVSTHFPHARLVIAGDGSLRGPLQDQIERSGMGGSCRLLGHVDDVVALHHALDVMVQSSDYEGTPNVVLEAMALETPVVATAVGGTAELAAHGREALIVPAGDLPALTGAIEEMLTRPDAARERAAAARRRVETELSFEHRLRKLETIYRELAMGRQR
jgi:glycosyltransferase involved in cell wall biosynthesis